MSFIASTLSAAVTYVQFAAAAGNDIPKTTASVTIAGGSGVANRNIITPQGVITEITPEQLKVLEGVELFRLHRENGFLRVLEKDPGAPERVAADMNRADPSAPLTEASYTTPPKTGKGK